MGRPTPNQREKATLWQGISHAIGCFVKMYILKAGFLDGKQGFLLAVLSAHSTFVKYAGFVGTQSTLIKNKSAVNFNRTFLSLLGQEN